MKPAGLAVSVWVLCFLAAGALCVGCPKSGPYEQTQSFTANLADGGALTVNNFRGNISVRGWDGQQVSIIAKKSVTLLGSEDKPDQEGGRRYLDLIQVSVLEDGQNVTLNTQAETRLGSEMSVDLEVIVPRHASVRISNSFGDVDCADFDAPVIINTFTGNVSCSHIGSDVEANTAEGNIACDDVEGSLKLNTARGFVDALHPAPLPPAGSIKCNASEGAVTIGLPEDAAFKLDAHTAAGRIAVAPDFMVAPQDTAIGSDITVDVNGGGIPVTLNTASGDIEIGVAVMARK
jgi:hypothetical protein